MDQSKEAQAGAAVLVRVLESIVGKLKAEKGLTDEQIALALMAVGLNTLSKVWNGQEVVDHLAGVTWAMAETHGIQPNGEVIARGRPN